MATNNKKATTNKKEVNKESNGSLDLQALQAQMAALIAQNSELQAQLKEMKNSQNSSMYQTDYSRASANDDVTVVYCSDSLGCAKAGGVELNFTRYGEEFIISRTQFDQLVGKYRSWFDKGILAVSYKNVDVAAAKGLKTDKELGLSPDTLFSIGDMSSAQLENLWNSMKNKSQKESIVLYFKRKFIEGDPKFVNREKVDLMNRLTEGGFIREQDEISGRYKISPTIM